MRDALQFRELRGDYDEAQKGQVIEPNDYLDYFEPLGSALSRLADGAGGPFVHQFSRSGGRVIGAIGWVVSAAAKRMGGWRLWGMWTDRAVPPLTIAFLWPHLSDSRRLPELIRRANENAHRLVDPNRWDELDLDPVDEPLRDRLKAQLARAYATPAARERPIEVEVDRATIDLLPWLYLLGPADPAIARLQPSRFNGAGYQYIVTDSPRATNEKVPRDIDRMVDIAANDTIGALNMAAELRAPRPRPKPTPAKRRQPETHDMPTASTPPPRNDLRALAPTIWRVLCDVIVIALLAWIAVDVRQIRKSIAALPAPQPVVAPPPATPAPLSREERLVAALEREGIRVTGAQSKLPQIAIEIFLRRNRCFTGTALVDGTFSAAEQRAIRNCTALREQRLVKSNGEPDAERAVGWLEGNL